MARVAGLVGAMLLAAGAWLAVVSCSGPSLGLVPAVNEQSPDEPSAPGGGTAGQAGTRAPSRPMSAEQKEAVIERTTALVRDRAYASGVDFGRWETILGRYQQRLDDAMTSEQFSRHLNRALNEFGISHLDVLAPSAATRRRENTYGGIGVVISPAEQGLRIEQVREGSPAEKSGLRAGDLVTEVDGKPVSDLNAIRGEPGTSVELTVKREAGKGEGAQASVEKLTLTRGKISTATPPSLELLGEDAAVLKLRSFTEGYDRGAVERLFRQARGRSLLVLDLRDNGGGSVSNLMHLLGLMLPAGSEVGTFVSRQMAEAYAEETGKDASDVVAVAAWSSRKMRTRRVASIDPFAGQIAVLVNGASASASEITAAALRELRSAPLVGTRTAGAVLLSTYVRMEGGFEMKVPTSDYVTIKGQRLEDRPLVPDVNAGSRFSRRSTSAEQDPVVGEALEHLRANADAGLLRSE
jgi:carboxyl-terminal processing protease